MKIFHTSLLFTMLSPFCFGQAAPPAPGTGTGSTPAQSSPGAPASATPSVAAPRESRPKPSAQLQPALDNLGQAVGALNLEKWKKGSIRDEASTNLNSIQRDLQSTLPPILTEADGAPQVTSKLLPVTRNIDALYDVLLRVVDGARIAAPSDQFAQLQTAMTGLDKARHTLNDAIQETASAQEKQIGDLRQALKTQPAPVCPAVSAPPPAPAPAKKPAPKKKRKPSTTPAKPADNPPAAAPKPNS
jgi:hypothetical protein